MIQDRIHEAALVAWGEAIGREISRPAVFALVGPLGAGKSTLARAMARGAGVVGPVPSPTYNLVLRHDTPVLGPFVHVDLYRLETVEDILGLGWEELFDEPALFAIEWSERAKGLLPTDHWQISLQVDVDQPENRDVRVAAFGNPPELPTWPLPSG